MLGPRTRKTGATTRFVGLDGYRRGWVAVSITNKKNTDGEISFLSAIGELKNYKFKRAMIDIPIGLPECGYRACDVEAREKLGKHRNRVFLGGRRPLLAALDNFAEANRLGRESGMGVSMQLFCLLPKINEVDKFAWKYGQSLLQETHPELVFLRLGRVPVPNKKTPGGRAERIELIKPYIRNVDRLLDQRLGTGAKLDDVLDACACAIAAKEANEEHRLPRKQQTSDSKGLKMEIWF